MGILTKEDLIDDDALKAPLILKENLETLMATINQLIEATKKYQSGLASDDSLPKIKQDTENLSLAQAELIKIQNQIAVQVARDNDAYREQQAILKNLKDEMKNNQALQDVTKGFTAQNASLVELEKALNSNRVAYANLRGEAERGSKQGQDLLKNIQDQSKAVADLRDKMGQHKITAEDFNKKISESAEAVKKFAPEAIEAGEAVVTWKSQLLALVNSPLTLGLAVIAGGFAGIKKGIELYTEGTIEGAEKANLFAASWDTAVEVIQGGLKGLGRTLVSSLGDPEEGGIFGTIIKGLISQLPSGISLLTEYNVKFAQNIEIRKLENEILKEEIILTAELAEKRLESDDALFQARDKVHNENQKRYDELLLANALIKESEKLKLEANDKEREAVILELQKKDASITKDITINELLNNKIFLQKAGYELAQKFADVEAKRAQIEDETLKGARRRQALEATLVDDEEKRQLTAVQTNVDAKIKLNEIYIERRKNISERIVGNERYSLDRQLEAEKFLQQALIDLDNSSRLKEEQAAKKAAIERIHLNQSELDSIYADTSLSYQERVKKLIDTKEEAIKNDKAYNTQLEAIEQDHVNKQKVIIQKGVADVSKIYVDYYKDVASKSQVSLNEENQRIEEAYNRGEINVVQYERFKEISEQNFKVAKNELLITELQDEIKYYDSLSVLTREQELARTEGQKKLAETELAQKRDENSRKLAIDKQYNQLRVQLENQVASTILSIGDGLFDRAISQKNAELNNTKAKEQELLTEAGNNAEAKAKISRKYAAIEKQEQKEIAEKQREKAIFDKALSAAQVLVKTAEAIATQLPGLPFTAPLIALIGSIGAVEEAAILATPIPQYAKGTKHAKEGWSLIDDGGGNEIVQEPSGKAYMYDIPGAKMTYLKEGSKVFTAEESNKIANSLVPSFSGNGVMIVEQTVNLTPLIRKFDEMHKTMRNKKELHINVTKEGVEALVRSQNSWSRMIGNRYK